MGEPVGDGEESAAFESMGTKRPSKRWRNAKYDNFLQNSRQADRLANVTI